METKSMLLIGSWWQGAPTFRMIPTTKDCPFAEVIFINGTQKGMAVISIKEYEKLELVPKLDDKGMEIPVNINGKPTKAMQRISMRTLYEYQIFYKEEMIDFVKRFAINEDKFDYMKYVDMDFAAAEDPAKSTLSIVGTNGKPLTAETKEEKK